MDDFSWLIDHFLREIPDKSSRIPRCDEVKDRLAKDAENLPEGLYCEVPPENDLYYNEGKIPESPQIISDVHGRIDKIFMTYPYDGKDFFKYKDFFESFVGALPKKIEVYILGNITKEKKKEIKKNGGDLSRLIAIWQQMQDELIELLKDLPIKSKRFTVIPPLDLHGYSIWAQDPFIPAIDLKQEKRTIHFIEPVRFKDSINGNGENLINADSKIADYIAMKGGFKAVSTFHSRVCLFFQGGNVLSGDDFILVGQDDIYKSREFFKRYFPEEGLKLEKHKKLIEAKKVGVYKAFQHIFGQEKEVVPIGFKHRLRLKKTDTFRDQLYGLGDYQPFYHIDLFLTPAGKLFNEDLYTIILADPFNASPEYSPEADKYIFRPLKRWLLCIKLHLEKKKLGGKRKFIVRPMPMPVIPIRKGSKILWTPISYNNCLVEISRNIKRVWVPQYQEEAPVRSNRKPLTNLQKEQLEQLGLYDQLALKQWQSYGFKTRSVGGCFPFILRGGSLRCITKCLHRSDI